MMYEQLLGNMITDWRSHWAQGDFPFIQVQLANYMKPDTLPTDHPWARLREAQYQVGQKLPNVGMACIIDIGEANDIHPRNKKDVGYRLAQSAFKVAYNQDVLYSGPIQKSIDYKGNKAIVTFDHVGDGLVAKNGGKVALEFAVAGKDQQFYYAEAQIIANNQIEVQSNNVENIVAIRYAWAANPDKANLYNSAGLPALPFRTDSW
jgi:sialate O-acetylesterase